MTLSAQEAPPIIELVSHIDGRNAKVRLWPDRLEWERPRGLSAGKVTAGVFTMGASLLATGVKSGKDAYDMVLLRHVTNVASRKDGFRFYAVDVQTSAGAAINTVSFRVTRDEATSFRSAILVAMQALDAPQAVPTPQPVAAPARAADLPAQLQQLAALRDAGVLTEEEFATKKAEILARM